VSFEDGSGQQTGEQGDGGTGGAVDADGDGIPDNEDSCPNTVNDGVDADNDGIDDACDTEITSDDVDSDGVLNSEDNCPAVANPDQKNTDSDLYGDACDIDSDGDGVEDTVDNCPLVFNESQADRDDDGQGDVCDVDADGDGVNDKSFNSEDGSYVIKDPLNEADPGDNCPLEPNKEQVDADGNGVGDACETGIGSVDSDGDGVVTGDNCPNTANPDQADLDGDGVGDACDVDMDGDQVNDKVDLLAGNFTSLSTTLGGDNCPSVPNGPEQEGIDGVGNQTDSDGDNIGDACDAVDNARYECGVDGQQYSPMLASDPEILATAEVDTSECLVNNLGELVCGVENPENVVNDELSDFAVMSNDVTLLGPLLELLGLPSELKLNVAVGSGYVYPKDNVVGVAFDSSESLLELDLQGGDIQVRTLLNGEVVQDSNDISGAGLDLLGLSGFFESEETNYLIFQTAERFDAVQIYSSSNFVSVLEDVHVKAVCASKEEVLQP